LPAREPKSDEHLCTGHSRQFSTFRCALTSILALDERFEVGQLYSERIRNPRVRQLSPGAERVNGGRTHAQLRRNFTDGQELDCRCL
jgi:hypothetical protein